MARAEQGCWALCEAAETRTAAGSVLCAVGRHGHGHWEPSEGLRGHEGWAEGLLMFF